MLKNHTHQVNRNCNYLPDVFEINLAGLLENNLVLIFEVDKPDVHLRLAVAVCQLAEEYELVVANGVFRGVDGLNYVYDTRHTRYSVEDNPVTDN